MLEDWNGVGGFPNGDPGPGHAYFDNVSLASTATGDVTGCAIPPSDITVDVDIKPGSDVNPINTRSKGVIPVAILTTDDFDATTVDASTVEFGPGGASIAHKKAHLEDVDDDGDIDLVMHFRTQDAGISSGDVKVCLTGVADGTDITGCDVVRVK